MPPTAKRGLWQRIRRPFRWCRIALWSLILFLLGSFLYLNVIGLPQFLKAPLVTELRARGIDLEFSRLRLRWFQGLVAESVHMGGTEYAESPEFSVAEVAVKLDLSALRRFRFKVSSLIVRDGRLDIPLRSADEPTQRFTVRGIGTELRLLPDDRWELNQFEAICLGAKLKLSGMLTNASAVRDWPVRRSTNQTPGLWQTQLRHALRVTRQMQFSQPPEIHLSIRGDAQDPASITADLTFSARDADTAWGKLDRLLLIAKLNHPSGSNDLGRSELQLQIDGARTPWIGASLSRFNVHWVQAFTNPVPSEVNWDWEFHDVSLPWGRIPQAHFSGHTFQSSTNPVLLQTDLVLDSGVFQSKWMDCQTNRFTAQLIHAPGDLIPRKADWQWVVNEPQSRWGGLQHFEFTGQLIRSPTNSPPQADPNWAWWTILEPFQVNWAARIDRVTVTNILVDRIHLSGKWLAPELIIDQLQANLYEGRAHASARINVGTRAVQSDCEFDFDVHRIAPLLTPDSQRWLRQYSWNQPPKVAGRAGLVLPAWTNSQPDWRGEVLPTVVLDGFLEGRDAAYRGVPVSHAQTHFSYSNFVWRLPDFVATRPEGRVEFAHTADSRTHTYHFKVRSQMDPLALKPMFGEKASRAFDLFEFTTPPLIEGEVSGRWREPDTIAATAAVSAANFVLRGEPVSDFTAAVEYTNRSIMATGVSLRSAEERVTAVGVGFDLSAERVYLLDAVSRMDPQRVTRVIGPKVAKTLSPYVFKQPPHARVKGWAEVRHGRQADMQFEISGGPFNYMKFNVPQISAMVHWVDETVTITNVAADFYNGRLAGDFHVDFAGDTNADFQMNARVTDTDLHLLMSDISSPTNRLEGILGGELIITNANTHDWGSWNGFGNVRLRDGFLWDIPLFGIFSPILDAVIPIPGVGNSRVSGGTATFNIRNSVIRTDDMDIRSPAMRLAYRGAIDFKGNVDARVEARLLRDVWVVGPLVSLVLSPLTKLFEYKVTGTLREPEKEPLHIPKPFQFPFHPFKTLKEMFTEEKSPSPAREKPPTPQR
ncbi:MAG TPA: AsmA-like C-terminal region-containing protein [Verrucomicrobiae bacterium]|nr:AsmA-like C-terminal region-containing protein [Verrucomicrobiae bacterium]